MSTDMAECIILVVLVEQGTWRSQELRIIQKK